MATPQRVVYPDINGNRYSAASVRAVFGGLYIVGFKSIKYGKKLTPGGVYGAAPQKIGRTRGKAEQSCSFVMYKEEYENLRLLLGAGGVGYMEVPFEIVVAYAELGQAPVVDTIVGVRIMSDEEDVNTDSQDAQAVTVETDVMDVLRGGLDTAVFPFPIL